MYTYKKVPYELAANNLSRTVLREDMDKMFGVIEENAAGGWRFVQFVHPYSVNTPAMLVFEKEG